MHLWILQNFNSCYFLYAVEVGLFQSGTKVISIELCTQCLRSLLLFFCFFFLSFFFLHVQFVCSRAPKKNTSHGNEVLPQDTTHLIQRPCYQQGSPCQDPAGNWITRRPLNRKETQVWPKPSCKAQ